MAPRRRQCLLVLPLARGTAAHSAIFARAWLATSYNSPMSNPADIPILRWEAGCAQRVTDELAEEEPLEIRVRNTPISVTMRTSGNDEELAAGFLLTEGVIHAASDIVRIEPCGRNEFGNIINVVVGPLVRVDFEKLTRHVFAASSCGLCGKASIDAVRGTFCPMEANDSIALSAEALARFPATMEKTQAVFARTGGLHAAALFDLSGNLIVLREDIGRHNAVDKVIGHCLLKNIFPLDQHVLLVSGRASFEIMQKALAARVPIIAAVSAPSSLAVRFAQENHQTLIGFLRGNRMNLYAHPHRVKMSAD